ncbi:hypothetical protein E3Q16_01104 [Wallemia mellicola]|nr:hypothetical protein E3Q16_01104 [Wallemia mellicola]
MDDIKASLVGLTRGENKLENLRNAIDNSQLPIDDKKALVETTIREEIQSYSTTRSIAPQYSDDKVTDPYHTGLLSKLGILVDLLKSEMITPNSVVPIISDTLDIHPLSSATVIFSFLTNFMSSDDSNQVKTISTRNNLLKTSNELLRRASRTRNSELCGEILLFLTSIMPLTDRSATNFRGDIRESNKTFINDLIDSPDADDSYKDFWRLQSYLTDPMSIYNGGLVKNDDKEVTHIESFKQLFSNILDLLVQASDKEIKMSGSKLKKDTKRKADELEAKSDNHESNDAYFFPEYLAQPKLFPLQVGIMVADPSFRCCVFIQMFIIVQFIVSVYPKELLKAPEIKNPQEKIIKSGIQSDKPLYDWASNKRAILLKSLPKVSPNNLDITQPIVQLMKREKHWVYWKMENCPMIELPRDDPELLNKAEESRISNIFKSLNPNPCTWGTESLSESFEEGYQDERDLEFYPRAPELKHYVNMAKLDTMKAKKRKTMLGLDDNADSSGDLELEELKSHKQSLSWRGFRCVARSNAPIIASLPPGSDVEGLQAAIEKRKQAQAQKAASKESSPAITTAAEIVDDGQRQEQTEQAELDAESAKKPANGSQNKEEVDEQDIVEQQLIEDEMKDQKERPEEAPEVQPTIDVQEEAPNDLSQQVEDTPSDEAMKDEPIEESTEKPEVEVVAAPAEATEMKIDEE